MHGDPNLETTPKVAQENNISLIRVNTLKQKAPGSFLKKTESKFKISQSPLLSYMAAKPTSKYMECDCPNILIADDDAFQHLIYQKVIGKEICYDRLNESKENFKASYYNSGEELLQAFKLYKGCWCQKIRMIILDFNMGHSRYDGVETALELRKADFRGVLLLRTSERVEDISSKHENFKQLLLDSVLDGYVNKNGVDSLVKFIELNYNKMC